MVGPLFCSHCSFPSFVPFILYLGFDFLGVFSVTFFFGKYIFPFSFLSFMRDGLFHVDYCCKNLHLLMGIFLVLLSSLLLGLFWLIRVSYVAFGLFCIL